MPELESSVLYFSVLCCAVVSAMYCGTLPYFSVCVINDQKALCGVIS
jgi:hypothetical protein